MIARDAPSRRGRMGARLLEHKHPGLTVLSLDGRTAPFRATTT